MIERTQTNWPLPPPYFKERGKKCPKMCNRTFSFSVTIIINQLEATAGIMNCGALPNALKVQCQLVVY